MTYFNNDPNGAENFGYGKQTGVNTLNAHKNIAQNVFSKFAGFWKKNKRNKILTIIAGVLLLMILTGAFNNASTYHSNKSHSWPDNSMAKMLPKPEGKITYLSIGSRRGDFYMRLSGAMVL